MAAVEAEIIEIGEIDINVGRVMEITEPVTITPNMLITVPAHYYGVPYVDGEPMKRIKSCQKKKLSKFIGADKTGKSVSVLYVSKNKINTLPWGSGNLPIKYERFGGATIRVGANGTFLAEIREPDAFYDSLGRKYGQLNMDEVKSRIISSFRKSISDILSELFVEAGEPVFETEFMIDELDRRINARVCEKPSDELPGVYFVSSSVMDIRISEADKNTFMDIYEKNKKEFLKAAKKR
jgi:membrane protease subunit (stomatin/prohibitin family)